MSLLCRQLTRAASCLTARLMMGAAWLALALVATAATAASPATAPSGGTILIAPGVEMPVLANGFGPFDANANTTAALENWFQVGGRAVDTAFEYSNQPWVGAAVRATVARGLLRRDQIFVMTKIKCIGTTEGALGLVREDLRRLGLDYVDLVLIHGPGYVDPQSGGSRRCDGWRFNQNWPNRTCCRSPAELAATYRGLELAAGLNLTRAIGVSNFQTRQLEAVLANATIRPAVNQMELSVGCHTAWCATNNATMATGRAHGVTFQAYSPLGHGKAIANPVVQSIARAHNVSSAQVALAWIAQQGHAMVTSSSSQQYDREDLKLDRVQLTESEMRRLNSQ